MNRKEMGMSSKIHPTAIVETENIGDGVRIGAFVHILTGAKIGADCNICDHVLIEDNVVIGNRVTVNPGAQLLTGVRIDDDVFIGPHVTFAQALLQNGQPSNKSPVTVVQKSTYIEGNVTISTGITIGPNALVKAGAVVTKDIPPNAIVQGNPAQITGYVQASRVEARQIQSISDLESLTVQRVRLIELPKIVDLRGSLTFGEIGQQLPFMPKRYFVVFDVPSMEVRGEHAHRELQQFLVCLKGSCAVMVDDGKSRDEIILDKPDFGVYLPPMIWGIQYKFTADAILLVLASDVYDADDYIRDYGQFKELVNGK
jgi:acetyltransferase-like isoleucine patch superfamily enzyme